MNRSSPNHSEGEIGEFRRIDFRNLVGIIYLAVFVGSAEGRFVQKIKQRKSRSWDLSRHPRKHPSFPTLIQAILTRSAEKRRLELS